LYQIKPQSFSAYAESTYHAVLATLDGCILTLQAIKPHGTVFDATTLKKTCTAPTPELIATPSVIITLNGPRFLPVIWKKA
jgi:hypothetical protein